MNGRRMALAAVLSVGLVACEPGLGVRASAQAVETHAKGDMSGQWQGTLEAQRPLRVVLKFVRADKGWTGKMYSIDQGAQGFSATEVMLDGNTFKFTVDVIGASYTGTLSADGRSVVGMWSQGPTPRALTLVRALKETAWEIPAPPPPRKLMAADADPGFDVATIKPDHTGATSMQQLTLNGRNFQTRASSLGDLISFAYQVEAKQIVGAPDWVDRERYDVAAVPDTEGDPNPAQLRGMIQKLLRERFKLTFHMEKRELPAFVLTVAKGGEKLTATELKGPLPGIGYGPAPGGISLMARNATIGDYTGFLQNLVLDRPVVDKTGLTGKYDLRVTFSPDDSMFHGHPPPFPKTEGAEAAPGFFEAMQQQLGLKMEAQKTGVDVMVVDKVEKPSAN